MRELLHHVALNRKKVDRAHDKPLGLTLPAQKGDVAFTLVTERKVRAYPDLTDVQVRQQHVYEICRPDESHLVVKGVGDHQVNSQLAQQTRPFLGRCEVEMGLGSAQYLPGQWEECERCRPVSL